MIFHFYRLRLHLYTAFWIWLPAENFSIRLNKEFVCWRVKILHYVRVKTVLFLKIWISNLILCNLFYNYFTKIIWTTHINFFVETILGEKREKSPFHVSQPITLITWLWSAFKHANTTMLINARVSSVFGLCWFRYYWRGRSHRHRVVGSMNALGLDPSFYAADGSSTNNNMLPNFLRVNCLKHLVPRICNWFVNGGTLLGTTGNDVTMAMTLRNFLAPQVPLEYHTIFHKVLITGGDMEFSVGFLVFFLGFQWFFSIFFGCFLGF